MNKTLLLVPVLVLAIGGGAAFLLHRAQEEPPAPVTLEPEIVIQGGEIRLSDSGFFPEEMVDVRVPPGSAGTTEVELRQAQANLQGSLDAVSVVLPEDLPSGAHLIQLMGRFSGRQTSATVYVRARAPWLTVGPGDMKPRAPLGVVVGGFTPSEPVLISMQPKKSSSAAATPVAATPVAPQTLGELPTDRVGNSAFFQLKVPFRAPGDYVLLARGERSGQELRKAVTLAPYSPTFDLSPWFGTPGQRVQLNARGFAPGEQVQIFVGNVTKQAATVTADQYGNFWGAGNVPIPYRAFPGSLDIRATGVDSGVGTTRQFSVEKPKPWLELSVWYGAPSAPVSFSGGGWAAGEQISFHIDSAKNPAVASGQADAYGWLHDAGPIYVPRDATNQVTFVAVGQQSHSVATAKFAVILPFGLRPEN